MSPIEHINSCRLRPHRGESFAYDGEGNLTQRTGPSGTVNYTWNALGQLVTVASSQGTVTTYGYDGWGQRVRKSVNSVITRYLLHNANVVMEVDAYNGILAEYTYYPGADRPHGMRRGGVQYYYAQDAEGNVRGVINTAGTVVASYDYSPQGELVGSTGSVVNPYRYKGREWDAEAGLYFMRARYYDPKVARFVSEDPIGVAGGMGLYVFGGGDPVNHSDPSGTEVCWLDLGAQWTEIRADGATVIMSDRPQWKCVGTSGGHRWAGWKDAGKMLWEFLLGSGPSNRIFYDGSNQAEDMRNAPGVEAARKIACDRFRDGRSPNVTNFPAKFGFAGPVLAGLNPTRQFIGSYNVDVVGGARGTMTYFVRNNTTMTSFAYHLTGSYERDYFSPGGTMRQLIIWQETNAACQFAH